MSKRILVSLVLLLALLSGSLAACAPGAAPAPELPTVKWGFQANDPSGHYSYKIAAKIADRISARTNGKFTMDVFDLFELGLSSKEFSDALAKRTFELGVVYFGHEAGTHPYLGIMGQPFLYEWPNDFYTAGEAIMPIIAREFKKIGPITPIEFYALHPVVLWTKETVADITDIGGLRIRTWDDITNKIGDAMGAEPIQMGFDEVYVSLQRGVIDGLYTGIGSLPAISAQDFIKHGYNLGLPPSTYYLCYNDDAFNELPGEYQVILLEEAERMAQEQHDVAWPEMAVIVEENRSFGVEVHEVSPEDMAVIRERLAPLWGEWADRVGPVGHELLDKVRTVLHR